MDNFVFESPTKIIFGQGTCDHLEYELRSMGAKSLLVLYGSDRVRKNGLLDSLEIAAERAGAKVELFGSIEANPHVSTAIRAAEVARKVDADFLLGVGGGSVLDVAKAAAVCAADPDINLTDLLMGRASVNRCLPLGAVLTIAGSGSEASASAVLTIDDSGMKRSFGSDLIRPRFAILDPTYTYSLPQINMVAGACDILMHTMERYFSPTEDTELIDSMAEGLMRTVINLVPRCIEHPCDYNARANLMWAGTLSHNGLLGTGRVEDWSCHKLEHELSGLFNVVHGAGLCAVWGSWASYVQPKHPERFAQFARNVMGISASSEDEQGKRGIEALIAFFRSIGMPTTIVGLEEVELTEDVIDQMARNCLAASETIGGLEPLGYDDIVAIYRKAGEMS